MNRNKNKKSKKKKISQNELSCPRDIAFALWFEWECRHSAACGKCILHSTNKHFSLFSSTFFFSWRAQICRRTSSTSDHHAAIQYLCCVSIDTSGIERAPNAYFGDAPNTIRRPSVVRARWPCRNTPIRMCCVCQRRAIIIRLAIKFVPNTNANSAKITKWNNHLLHIIFFLLHFWKIHIVKLVAIICVNKDANKYTLRTEIELILSEFKSNHHITLISNTAILFRCLPEQLTFQKLIQCNFSFSLPLFFGAFQVNRVIAKWNFNHRKMANAFCSSINIATSKTARIKCSWSGNAMSFSNQIVRQRWPPRKRTIHASLLWTMYTFIRERRRRLRNDSYFRPHFNSI